MRTYLGFIGTMNALGTLLLLGALNQGFADGLLRRWTWLIPQSEPYRHSPFGRVWLWWAVIGTAWFSVINFVAMDWPVAFARVVAWGNVGAYGAFEALAIAATLSMRYGPGMTVAHVLWIAQAGWGLWVLYG